MKKISLGENPEGGLPGRCFITIPIFIEILSLSHMLRKFTGGYKL